MSAWGWRVPFLIGCLIVPFLFLIRRSLQETEAFAQRKHRPRHGRNLTARCSPTGGIVLPAWRMVIMTTVSFYLITAYTPTFGKEVLKLSSLDSLVVTVCHRLSNLIWLPLSGACPIASGAVPCCWPVHRPRRSSPLIRRCTGWWRKPSFARLLGRRTVAVVPLRRYNGAMVVALTEMMPVEVRTAGFSLAYSLATTIGGFTPAISTLLIHTHR